MAKKRCRKELSKIDLLRSEYDDLARDSQEKLQKIMDAVSGGVVPEEDQVQDFKASVTRLREEYDKIPAPASSDCLEASLSALRKKEQEISILTWDDPDLPSKRREIAKILLKRFARIRSSVKGYAKSLAPYQQQALDLLPTVDSYTELPDIEKLTTGPRLFFRALEIVYAYPHLPYDIREALEEFYSNKVLLGIIGRKYSLSAEEAAADETENRTLEKLGYDPSFVIKEDVLMEYSNKERDEIIVIPPWIRVIDGLAFRDCKKAKRVIIPDSVQEIKYGAFHNAGFVSVAIPDSVTKLGSEVFSDCGHLKSVVIGRGITTLPDRTFEYCQLLDHLELPATLKSVETYAFEKCYSLKTAWVDGKEYQLRDPDAPKPVKLVYDSLERIRDRIQSDYDNGLMDEFEYVDYNIAGDGYSY